MAISDESSSIRQDLLQKDLHKQKSHPYGRDFYETYASVVKLKSFRTLMFLAVNHGITLWQVYVPTAFLKGDSKEDIWVKLSDGLEVKLNKTFYGLKQFPMEWKNTLNEFLINYGLKRCEADRCIY